MKDYDVHVIVVRIPLFRKNARFRSFMLITAYNLKIENENIRKL